MTNLSSRSLRSLCLVLALGALVSGGTWLYQSDDAAHAAARTTPLGETPSSHEDANSQPHSSKPVTLAKRVEGERRIEGESRIPMSHRMKMSGEGEGEGGSSILPGLYLICPVTIDSSGADPSTSSSATGTAFFRQHLESGFTMLEVIHDVASPTSAVVRFSDGTTAIDLGAGTSPIFRILSEQEKQDFIGGLYTDIQIKSGSPEVSEIGGNIDCSAPLFTCVALASGDNLSPASGSANTGIAMLHTTMAFDGGSLSIEHDIANPTVAHLHAGAAGENGPIVLDLGDATSPVDYVFTSAEWTLLQSFDDIYVDIHDASHPDAVIRANFACDAGGGSEGEGEGDIGASPPPSPGQFGVCTAELNGGGVVPASGSTATATAIVTMDIEAFSAALHLEHTVSSATEFRVLDGQGGTVFAIANPAASLDIQLTEQEMMVLGSGQWVSAEIATSSGTDVAGTFSCEQRCIAQVDAASVVPPSTSVDTGLVTLTFTMGSTSGTIHIEHDVPHPTSAELRFGEPGVVGTFVADLGNPTSPITYEIADVTSLADGNYHVEIYDAAHPAGAIRGDIPCAVESGEGEGEGESPVEGEGEGTPPEPWTEVCTFPLTGGEVVPSVTTSTTGTGYIHTHDTTGEYRITIQHDAVDPVNAQLASGAAGVNGTWIVGLGSGASPIEHVFTPSELALLQASTNGVYFFVASSAYPSGEIRGQLPLDCIGVTVVEGEGEGEGEANEDIIVCSVALDESQVVSPTGSTATGTATFVDPIDVPGIELEIIHDVSNPTAAYIRSGVPGVNGSDVLMLPSAVSPITTALTDAQFNLFSRDFYIVIESTEHPDGEIRGDILCGDWRTNRPVYFVDKANTAGPHDGLSWATAFATIQDGIDHADSFGGGDLWIASGVYDESRPANNCGERGALVIKPDVRLYGGFTGTETTFAERTLYGNPTVIDGRSANNGGPAGSVVHFTAWATVFDGFIVTGGDIDDACGSNAGAGIRISNCHPIIRNVCVIGNRASSDGAGIHMSGSSPTLENVIVTGNMSANPSAPSQVTHGGGIFVTDDSHPRMRNVTVAANWSVEASGFYNDEIFPVPSDGILVNGLFWDNYPNDFSGAIDATYTMSRDKITGTGNLQRNALFWHSAVASWSIAPTHDLVANTTTFTNSAAANTLDSLVGMYLVLPEPGFPFAGWQPHAVILANDATTITVGGDWTGFAAAGTSYRITDYSLEYGSSACDTGIATGTPTHDVLGQARGYDGYDPNPATADGSGYDRGAIEYAGQTPGIIDFPDPNLEAVVLAAIGKGSGPIYADEVADTAFTILDAQDTGIVDLTGLEHCVELTSINFTNNSVSDVDALFGSHNLGTLVLDDNIVNDLEVVATLEALEYLYLTNNQLHDNQVSLDPVTNHSGIVSLSLGENALTTTEIASIGTMQSLQTLDIYDNEITDIQALSTLTQLMQLYVGRNEISSIAPLTGLTQLHTLAIYENLINDLAPLQGLTGIERLYAWNNLIHDLTPLAAHDGLSTLWISNNLLTNLAPLEPLTSLFSLNLAGNAIEDIQALSSNTGLAQGDTVLLQSNPLSQRAYCEDVPILETRGVSVSHDNVGCLSSRIEIEVAGVGTTSPEPGIHFVFNGDDLQIEAIESNPDYAFFTWLGQPGGVLPEDDPPNGVSSTTVNADGDKLVVPVFMKKSLIGASEGEGNSMEGASVAEGEDMAEGSAENEGENAEEGENEGEMEEAGCECGPGVHSADIDGDATISLGELLSVIQLANAEEYHCDTEPGDDSYAQGAGSRACCPHQADYAPQDWTIGIAELNRAIALFAAGTYSLDFSLQSPDGYAADAQSAPSYHRELRCSPDEAYLDAVISFTPGTLGNTNIDVLSLQETIPSGWTYSSFTDGTPPTSSVTTEVHPDGTTTITVVWQNVSSLALPSGFSYRVDAGGLCDASTEGAITGIADWTIDSHCLQFSSQPTEGYTGVALGITDTGLESAIRSAIGKPTGTLFRHDVVSIVNLDASELDITDLSGIRWLSSLETLDLSNNALDDIDELQYLTGLENLDLSGNQVSDISSLALLSMLTVLDLSGNPLTSLTGIEDLTQLTTLSLRNTGLISSDLSSLTGLANLTYLDLSENLIDDLTALSSLTALTHLSLSNNVITDLTGLGALSSLERLYLADNADLDDVDVLAPLTGLLHLDLSQTQVYSLEGLGWCD